MTDQKNIIRKIKYGVTGILFLFIVSFSILYFFKNTIAAYAISRMAYKLEQQYHTKFSVESIAVHSISEIEIRHLTLKPIDADTLFASKELTVSIRLLPLLTGKIRLENIFINSASLRFIQKGGKDNFSMFLTSRSSKQQITESNYVELADKILDNIFGKIPRNMHIENSAVRVQQDSAIVCAFIPSMKIEDHILHGKITLKEDQSVCNFTASGNINARQRKFDVSISKIDTGRIQLPFLEKKWKAIVGFDEIKCSFTQTNRSSDKLEAKIDMYLKGVYINQSKLAPEEIYLSDIQLDYKLHIEKTALEIDSASALRINTFLTNTYFRFEKDTSRKIALRIKAPWFNAQHFFNALPKGLFTTLKGIKTEGKLEYTFKLALDIDKPDSIEFISDLKQQNFKIISLGESNLTKINNDFILPVYDKEKFIRSLNVSASNPYYTTYDQLPQNLVYALLTSEDGGFMHHRGFNADAFKKSISENIKTKRFKRGGSTISMQLVKNVYLNKNKTISRKVEEVIIVWLIENQRLSSKERMLEVYFNIIEWGPDVYGVGEASYFYFNKPPGELTWNEAIYMASIVPSPKRFTRKFDEQGNLKQQDGYYRLLANIMVRRGQMTETEKNALSPNVVLTGAAKNYLKISADTTGQLSDDDLAE